MKRLIVAVVALVAIFALSSASVYAVEGLSAGVTAGLNISNLYGDDVEAFAEGADTKMKIGAAFGGFANYVINDYLAVQPELLYTMKGMKVDAAETISVSLNYLEIPILAKVSMPMEGKIKPSFIIGPAIGILLTAEVEDVDIKDDMKSIDFGLALGAGVNVAEVGPGNMSADVLYTLGLTSVPDVEDVSIKNWAISIMVGYAFPL